MLRSRVRIGVGAAVVAALVACGITGAGSAWAKPKPASAKLTRLSISPKAPKATDSIVVRFKAGALRPGERYLVGIGSVSSVALTTHDDCTPGLGLVVRGQQRRGRAIQVELFPNGAVAPGGRARVYGAGPSPGARRFCAGVQELTIGRLDPDGDARLLVRRKVTIARDAAYPEPIGTPVKVILLEGSSVLVQAPGRPDRTLPLAGTLTGLLPGRFMPNSDLQIGTFGGALSLSSIVPDPLCAGPAYATQLGIAPPPTSSMTLLTNARATMLLDLLADPRSIAGCATPASPRTTKLLLSGQVGPDGLLKLPLSATVENVPIAPDVAAKLTVNLLVRVDLSGRA